MLSRNVGTTWNGPAKEKAQPRNWGVDVGGVFQGGMIQCSQLPDFDRDGTPDVCDLDDDDDGVPDVADACLNPPAPGGVDGDGRPLGDLNGDCGVDLNDYAVFQTNLGGP
ncbi:MAG: hypothetical protein IH987_01195 [Planctomycetes bacterium]|nr:hypothetical protein [Planctomycetota bacterium]